MDPSHFCYDPVVARYLTIPSVTDAEEVVAFNTGSNGHSFDVVINIGDTSAWLFRAAGDGTLIPLVVVVTDEMMIALNDVVVSAAASVGSPVDTNMSFTLNARAVQLV